jgi:ribonuclease E
VQMTRKRVGTGLLEAYSETCATCNGRGVLVHLDGPPSHVFTPMVVLPSRPIPRPPSRRPDSAEAGDDAEAEEMPEAEALAETPDVELRSDTADVPLEAPPVTVPRRRRRATSKGPVSAPVENGEGSE